LAVKISPAEPMIAGFATSVLLDDDLNSKPDQRANVVRDETVGTDNVDHAPACRKCHADLGDAWIARTCRGVDPFAKRHLLGKGNKAQRVIRAIHGLIGARGRRRGLGSSRIEQLQSRGGPLDRRLADLIGMSEGCRFASHSAKAEARGAVVVGGLQTAVVEAEGLTRAILKEELTVVARGQMLGREPLRAVRIEASVEEAAGVGGHAASRSAGPPSRTKRRSQ